MRVNIFYADNGVGLQRDFDILSEELRDRGHESVGFVHNKPQLWPEKTEADLSIFLEVVVPAGLDFAPRNWLIPNPEWFSLDWVPYLNRFEKILCKTRHTATIFGRVAPPYPQWDGFIEPLGWRSRDLLLPEIPRERRFLHVGGKGSYRGTAATFQAWRHCGLLAPLIIVSEMAIPHHEAVQWRGRADDRELQELMNSSLFHILPTEIEGWGHALHEALSVGAVVITTQAPPMNEIKEIPVWVEPRGQFRRRGLADARATDAAGIHKAVKQALVMTPAQIEAASRSARARFVRETEEFRTRLDELFGPRKIHETGDVGFVSVAGAAL